MSKLLLIRPNDQKAVYGETLQYAACEPPFWMAVAAAYCRNEGIDVVVLDAEAENISFEGVYEFVERICPVLVGIFVTGTNLSASTQKMNGANLTTDSIKSIDSGIGVFYWGLHPSALPERTLVESKADYVITGENFNTIIRLLSGDKDYAEMPGLYYRINERIGKGSEPVLLSTRDIPLPAWDLLPMNRYYPHNWQLMGERDSQSAFGRYGVVSTNIGCPFNCSFCAISAQFGERIVRQWDIDRVLQQIDILVNDYNIKYIKILDECFVLNMKYVRELCSKIIERKYDLNIWAYARVNTVKPDILAVLRDAGVRWLAYGIESADYSSLKAVDKGQYDSNTTIQAMKWTKEADINIIANFMFGLPDDTLETMQASLDLCRKINPEWINFYVTMLYPGSRDYRDAVESGIIKNDKWIEYAQYSYECKPAGGKYLSPSDVLRYRDEAFVGFFKDNESYFQNIRDKFGEQYVKRIKGMMATRLKRKILGD